MHVAVAQPRRRERQGQVERGREGGIDGTGRAPDLRPDPIALAREPDRRREREQPVLDVGEQRPERLGTLRLLHDLLPHRRPVDPFPHARGPAVDLLDPQELRHGAPATRAASAYRASHTIQASAVSDVGTLITAPGP